MCGYELPDGCGHHKAEGRRDERKQQKQCSKQVALSLLAVVKISQ
jgi:hypothetical protein